MKPIKLKNYNTTFAEKQPEYLPLPAHVTKDGLVTTCWQLTLRERIKMFITGRIFLQLLTFHKPLQPIKIMVNDPGAELHEEG